MSTIEELMAKKQSNIDRLHRCVKGRTALMVIDMQRAFMEPKAALEVPPAWDLVPNIQKLVNCCRKVGVPVIYTEYVYSPDVPCLRGDPFGPEHLPAESDQPTGFGLPSGNALIGQKGPNSPDIIDELKPKADELVIQAHSYDKFYGTNLDYALRSKDIRYLIMTGIMADICVNCTLLSATTREYRATAITDCITTLWPHILEACFDIWKRKFARLLDSESMIAELQEVYR